MADEKQKSPTEELIDQCIESLKDEKKAKRAEQKALKTACDLKECVEDYKVCCLQKSREVWDTYNQLDLCYVVSSSKKVDLLNEDIKKYCDKENELEKKLKDVVKCVNETKTKLNEVVNEACRIDRCIKEEKRCKNGLYDQIKGAKNEWRALIQDIEVCSVDCFNIACKTFDVGVDVVGLQTFVDIESLKKLGEDLDGYFGRLETDVADNIQKAEAEWKKARTELVDIQQQLVTGKFAKCEADNCKDAVTETLEFLCDPGACDQLEPSLEDLCAKVKENFGKDAMDECDDDDDHEGKKKPTPRQKSKSEEDEDWEIE